MERSQVAEPVRRSDTHFVLSRAISWISLGLTTAIVVGWAGLLSLHVRGRFIWSHWPRGGPEDPKLVGEGPHYAFAGYCTAALLVFVLLAAVAAAEQQGGRKAKTAALLTAVVSLLMFYFGPWVWWYLD